MSGSDALTVLGLPFEVAYLRLTPQEPSGPPKFLTLLSTHTMLFVDPDRSSGSSPQRCLCVGFWGVKPIALCFQRLTRLYQALRSAVSPTGYVIPCVRFNCLVQLSISASSTVATLGLSGGLDLAQWGLPPHKKRQASLGALTLTRTASRPPAAFRVHSFTPQGRDAVARRVRDRHPSLLLHFECAVATQGLPRRWLRCSASL